MAAVSMTSRSISVPGPMTSRLGVASLEEAQSIKELLANLATSRAFLNRATEELQ